MSKVIVPALRVFTDLDPAAVRHLQQRSLYTRANFLAILPPLAIGLGIFMVMRRWDLFSLKLPEALGIDYYYSRSEVGFLRLCIQGSRRYADVRAKYYPLAKSSGEYAYDWWKAARVRYRRALRASGDRLTTVPMDIAGLTAYVRAKQFTGDVSYGVIVIAAVIAVLALTLL